MHSARRVLAPDDFLAPDNLLYREPFPRRNVPAGVRAASLLHLRDVPDSHGHIVSGLRLVPEEAAGRDEARAVEAEAHGGDGRAAVAAEQVGACQRHLVAHVPHLHHLVVAPGRAQRSVVVEGHRVDKVRVPSQRRQRLKLPHLPLRRGALLWLPRQRQPPQLRRLVVAPAQEVLKVRRCAYGGLDGADGDGADPLRVRRFDRLIRLVPLLDVRRRVRWQLPDSDLAVPAAGHRHAAVDGELHCGHPVFVAFKRREAVPRRRRGVICAGGEELPQLGRAVRRP
eukprot:1066960-Rhodomonas_salina.1